MRNLRLLICILLLACSISAQQPPQPSGITPKTGAVLDDKVYTNVFFGFSYRFPQGWDVSFVASDGSCAPECMLLDVRAPGYPKLPRSITISAETGAGDSDHLPAAALLLQQSGARKLAAVRSIDSGPRKLYRADYRSQLLNSDLYNAFIAIPEKNYLVVFNFTAEDRKQLDTLADQLMKDLSFLGPTSSSQ